MKLQISFLVCLALLTYVWAVSDSTTMSNTSTENEIADAPAENSEDESFDNPFADDEGITAPDESGGIPESIQPSDKKVKKPPFWYKYNFGKKYVTTLQKKLNIKVSGLVTDFKTNMTFMKGFLVFIFSFLYAILHTGGPGHGKLILGTYFLTSDQKRKKSDAAVAGLIVSLTHNGMAVLLSGILFLFIHSFGDQRNMQEIAKRIGGIFVIITGIVIMLTTVYRHKIPFFNEEKNAAKLKKYPLYIIAVLSGIVPCPLAWSVLVMCITMGLYGLGLLSVLGMALGAGITVGATGLIIISGKDKLFSYVNRDVAERVAHYLRFCGGLFLVFFGYMMTKII